MSSKTKSGPPKSIGRDYGRKPYISSPEDHYIDVMKRVTDSAMFNQALMKQSELKKPYVEDNYEEMETYFPGPFPDGFQPDFPGPVPDSDSSWGGIHRVGCILDCPLFITHDRECDKAQEGKPGYKEVCCSFNPAYETVTKVQILAGSPAVLTRWSQSEVCFRLNTTDLTGSYQKVRILARTTNSYCQADILVNCDVCPSAASITYTTLQMAIEEEQILWADPILSDGNLYEWAVTSGGGSLSSATGNGVTYTAPSTNANCAQNPTITLSCQGKELDSITIAVNVVTGNCATAVTECRENPLIGQGSWGHSCYRWLNCDGTYEPVGTCGRTSSGGVACGDWYLVSNCTLHWEDCSALGPTTGGIPDSRTEAQIAAGCCPEALL